MKKRIALILLMVAVLFLCGCQNDGKEEAYVDPYAGTFHVGYGRKDLTPSQAVPLSGYSNSEYRYSENFLNPVCATAIAITDEKDTTVIWLTMDVTKVQNDIVEATRDAVSEKLGIDRSHICVAASHTHSGIDFNTKKDIYITNIYHPWMVEQMIEACLDAYADRKPAEMYVGDAEAEGMNFVRQYLHTDKDGVVHCFTDNYGTAIFDSTTRHETDADPTIHLMQFKRENAEDIILANWRAHPHLTDGSAATDLSSDFIGAFREDMEMLLGCKFVFFQGAAGNINTYSRIQSENKTKELHAYSALMTNYAIAGLNNNMKKVENTTMQTRQYFFEAEYKKVDDNLLALATQCRQIFNATGDYAAAMSVVGDADIHSVYHAGNFMTLSKLTGNDSIEFDFVTFGDEVATCFSPHEVFDTSSMWIEDNSPYAKTFFFGYANQHKTYTPTSTAIDYGCYEADVTYWEKGTAEKEAQSMVDILTEMRK